MKKNKNSKSVKNEIDTMIESIGETIFCQDREKHELRVKHSFAFLGHLIASIEGNKGLDEIISEIKKDVKKMKAVRKDK